MLYGLYAKRGVSIGKLLKIGELSRESGLSKRTIDYYTNLGLLNVSHISENGYRKYDEESLEKIKMIEFYKTKHFTLDEIKCKLNSIKNLTEYEMRKKVENIWFKLEEAEAEISELKTLINDDEQIKRMLQDLRLNKSLSSLFEI